MLKLLLKTIPLPLQIVALRSLIARSIHNNPRTKGILKELEGKRILIYITDIKRGYHLFIRNSFIEIKGKGESAPDVAISGDMGSFLGLLKGKLDPDALFFSRILKVEGETAALVLFKNLLEAIR